MTVSKSGAVSARFRKVFLNQLMVSHIALLGAWITALVCLSALHFKVPAHYGVTACFVGWVTWTLTEYFLNRWLLHRDGSRIPLINSIIQYHAQHHDYPDKIEYNFIHPVLVAFTVTPVMISSWIMAGGIGLLFTSGYIFGYLWFIIAHTLQHHYAAPRLKFLKDLWQNHYLHHKSGSPSGFGVSTSMWDFVFRSLPPKGTFLTVDARKMKSEKKRLRVIPVTDRTTENLFLDVPQSVYAQDKNWIPCIRSEIENTFNPMINPYFTHGIAKRWILVDGAGEVSGRIAAFVDFKKIQDDQEVLGYIGFFECASGKKAAFLLFDAAVDWLVKYFMITTVEGPVNFGENDKFWGLLMRGFKSPSYGMNYNRPEYAAYFEEYGFKIHYKQLTNYLDLSRPLPERLSTIAARTLNNKHYRFSPFNRKKADQFVHDFLAVYNGAWRSFEHFQPMTEAGAQKSLAEMRPIMEDDLIWFAYADEKPVAFILALPDANEILAHCGDMSTVWGKIKFVYYRWRKGFTRIRVVAMGVVPEFQNRGLESALILRAYQTGKQKPQYKHVELSWVGDFNSKMIAIHRAMGAVEDKEHATFRMTL